MVRVMVPPLGKLVAGANTRTGATVAPETWDARVMEVKTSPVMARALTPTVKVSSVLDDILKPPNVAARAAPRVSPVRVMVIAAVPDAAPAIVRTISVLEDVAAGAEVAVIIKLLLVVEATVPKK